MSTGLSNPRRSVMICAVAITIGAAALLWGILAGGEGLAGVAIAIGLLLCILFTLFLFNFVWAVRLTDAMKRGDRVIARWTVPPETLEEFRANEKALNDAGRPNDYRLPRKIPPGGLEVIFSPDAAMIGETFFGLAKTGLARFNWIQIVPGNPLSIAFGMAMTSGRTGSAGATLTAQQSELRIPVARTANDEARKVLAHYTAVTAGKTIAKPGFWTFRIKLGLWAAGIGAAAFVLGLACNALKLQLGVVPLIMAVTGAVAGLFGLVLAGIAWMLRKAERADRTT